MNKIGIDGIKFMIKGNWNKMTKIRLCIYIFIDRLE